MTLRYFLIQRKTDNGNKLLAKKTAHHLRNEVVSSVGIVIGLIVFTYATSRDKMKGGLGSSKDTPAASFFLGVMAILVALICDALLYIGEEKYCFSANDSSNTEVILFCYGFNSINSFAALLFSGQTASSFAFLTGNQYFGFLVVAFSLCNFFGTHFLLHVVSEFDSSSAVMVTSVRKMFTVLCSFVIYPKPFGILHFCGLILVSGGIYMHESNRTKIKQEKEREHGAASIEEGPVTPGNAL